MAAATGTTNPQQISLLLQAIVKKGVDAKDAIPIVKALVEARIFSLKDLTESNMPASVDAIIQKKLLPPKKRKTVPSSDVVSSSGALSPVSSSSPTKRAKSAETISVPPITAQPETIMINRSPVLTLWAAMVAKHLYHLSLDEALSLGSAFASQTAQAKGQALGIYSSDTITSDSNNNSTTKIKEDETPLTTHDYQLMGQTICTKQLHATNGPVVLRAVLNDKLVDPHSAWSHLRKRFGTALGYVMAQMDAACTAAGEEELRRTAYRYYMHIRPNIPSGTRGWGAHGRLETSKLSDFYAKKEIKIHGEAE